MLADGGRPDVRTPPGRQGAGSTRRYDPVEQSQECVVFPCKAHFDASDAREGDTRWCDGPLFSHAQQLGHDGEWRPLPGAARVKDTVRS
jgi:hypothetical protein